MRIFGSVPSMPNESDRKRLGEAVRRDRLRIYGTVEKARLIAEISRGAWDHVESGDPVRGFTLAAVERALGWPQGRAEEILRDQTPSSDLHRAILEDPDLDDETRAALLALLDARQTPPQPPHQRHQSA